MRKFLLLFFIFFNSNIVKSQIILSNDSTLCCTFSYSLQALSSTPSGIIVDDTHGPVTPIGFTFNFYGVNYTQLVVSGNGYITFDLAQAGQYSPFSINTPIPNAGVVPQNAIMAPWQDIDPSVGGSITFE